MSSQVWSLKPMLSTTSVSPSHLPVESPVQLLSSPSHRPTNLRTTGVPFGNLRPGEYRIAAWEAIGTGLGNIPEFHPKFDDTATSIKLAEDAHENVQPVLISRDKADAMAAQLP